ncbi:restriction endonuclease subunit S [Elizabethkingia anophelis]|uniref:restriction endonuclease subunit S n=1 Tax=Elizabethkingia anophelis TaxID=1117645 RepID=UPI00200EF5D0|nr:restriction endonuclease subunit S [Elizabethkingia anophelis]MCL1034091.1 restriction endonuclease subunit S [Elizabethkingia anophelis]
MKEQQEKYNLPEGWAWATIDELIDSRTGLFKDGDWIETKDQNPEGEVRLIQLADIGDGFFRNRSDRFMSRETAIDLNCTFLKQGDILVARMPDPIGRACLFPLEGENKYVTVVDVAVIRIGDNSINNKLLLYFINSPVIRKQIQELQTGTTRKRISRGNLATIKFPIPPVNEQRIIVSKIEELFSELDSGISLLKDTIQKLKVYQQALLKSAFEGHLTEEWRKENTLENAEFLLTDIQKQREESYNLNLNEWKKVFKEWEKNGKNGRRPKRPDKIKVYQSIEENIKEFTTKPQGWTYCRVGQIADLITGYAFKSNSFLKNGFYPVIRMGNLYENKLDMGRNPVFLSQNIPQEILKKYSVNENDILLSLTGTKGKRDYGFVVKIPKGEKNLLINQRILSLKPLISNDFLYYLLQSSSFRDQFFSFETGGGSQGNVSSLSVEQIVVLMPSLQEQEEIVKILQKQFVMCFNLEQKILDWTVKLETLRQSILKKAFEGYLISQNIEDEPSSELLKQLQVERKIYLAELKQQTKQTPKKIKKMREELNIEEVLKTSDKPMDAKDVWQESKYKNNIEDFYKELKDIQEKIKVVTKGTESTLTLVK